MLRNRRSRWFSRGARALPRAGRALMFALLLMAGAGSAGCPDSRLGQPCDLGTAPAPATGGGQVVAVSSPALECPSRICLGGTNAAGTGALCTAGCESDADCEDGQTRADDPGDSRCASGFSCTWPTTVGAFACQKLCVCRDLVSEPAGGFKKPAACP
jgi:hypothetical protein